MSDEVVVIESHSLEFAPDCFKTDDMCKKAVEKCPSILKHVLNHLKREKMHNWAVEKILYDHLICRN